MNPEIVSHTQRGTSPTVWTHRYKKMLTRTFQASDRAGTSNSHQTLINPLTLRGWHCSYFTVEDVEAQGCESHPVQITQLGSRRAAPEPSSDSRACAPITHTCSPTPFPHTQVPMDTFKIIDTTTHHLPVSHEGPGTMNTGLGGSNPDLGQAACSF